MRVQFYLTLTARTGQRMDPADLVLQTLTQQGALLGSHEWVHTSLFACQPGIRRTLELLKQHFWWSYMDRDTREFVLTCTICARSRSAPPPANPWSHVAIDFFSGLPASRGNCTILTIVDHFKSAHFVTLPKLPTTLGIAQLLSGHVVRIHGKPLDIVSDRGPQFVSRVWKAFCKAMGASASLSSRYHPQMNGQNERTNQTLEAALRCVPEANPASLSSHLTWGEYTHNSLVSSATWISRFEASLDYLPPLFPIQEFTIAVPVVQDLIICCRKIWWNTHSALKRTKGPTRLYVNRHRSTAPLTNQVSQCGYLLRTSLYLSPSPV